MERADPQETTLVFISVPPQNNPFVPHAPGVGVLVELPGTVEEIETRLNIHRARKTNILLQEAWYCNIKVEVQPGPDNTARHLHIVNVTPLTLYDPTGGLTLSIPILEDTNWLFPQGMLKMHLLTERSRREQDLVQASAKRSNLATPVGPKAPVSLDDFRRRP